MILLGEHGLVVCGIMHISFSWCHWTLYIRLKEERPQHPVHCDYIQAVAKAVSIPVIAKWVQHRKSHCVCLVIVYSSRMLCLKLYSILPLLAAALTTWWRPIPTSPSSARPLELAQWCLHVPPCGTLPSSAAKGRCLSMQSWRNTSNMWASH